MEIQNIIIEFGPKIALVICVYLNLTAPLVFYHIGFLKGKQKRKQLDLLGFSSRVLATAAFSLILAQMEKRRTTSDSGSSNNDVGGYF